MSRQPRYLSRSFAGGEMSPEMFGRIDDVKFQNGAAKLQNLIAKPQGPAQKRPGFQFVREIKDSTRTASLMPFVYSSDQTVVLEVGESIVDSRLIGYVRFHTQGATLGYGVPRLYVTPINFSMSSTPPFTNGVDTAGEQILLALAHGLSVADPIVFTISGGGVLPAPLVVGTTYYAIVVDTVTIKVATTAANALLGVAINLTTNGAGASGERKVHFAYVEADLTHWTGVGPGVFYCRKAPWDTHTDHPPTDTDYWYRIPGAIDTVTFDLGTDRVLWTAHGLSDGNTVAFATTGTLPTGLTAGTVYYVRNKTANDFQVSATPTGSVIDLAGVPAGTHRALGEPIYEVPHTYAEADIVDIHFDQSADVMTWVHPTYPVRELLRINAERWKFRDVAFSAAIAAPTGLLATETEGAGLTITAITVASPGLLTTVSAHGLVVGDSVFARGIAGISGIANDTTHIVNTAPSTTTLTLKAMATGAPLNTSGGPYTANSGTLHFAGLSTEMSQDYVVTALADNGEESAPSSPVTATNNLFVPGSYNDLSWNAVTGAARYRVYKKQTGLYGFIGEVDAAVGTSFKDDNIGPDLGITPPIADTSLDGTEHPGAVGHFEGRRVFAGTASQPQDLWMTRSGTESDLSYHLPIIDSDRIYNRVAAREVSTIRHVVPLGHLLLLTSSAEYRVTPLNSDALTPDSLAVRPQSYVGASNVQPAVINTTLVFCAARGGHVRELGFQQEAGGYLTGDLSLRAAHLFDDFLITRLAYAKAPQPVVWLVSSSGKLLGLSYVPEESVGAWHQHTTDGTFESVAAVAEGDEDHVYVIVKRTINAVTKRYVERMADQAVDAIADCFFVDAGLTYDGPATTTLTGLEHLEAKSVNVLADGISVGPKTVTGGAITLATAASKVHVGLPYTAELQTLPVIMQVEAFGQTRRKNINAVWVRAFESGQFNAGPSATNTHPSQLPVAGSLSTGPEKVRIPGTWGDNGQVHVVQSAPLPLTIVGLTLEVASGD